MAFSRFRVQIITRILLLLLTIILDAYLIVHGDYAVTAALVGVIALLQAWSLVRYTERTERDLAHFLEAIAYDSYDISFPEGRGPTAQKLGRVFSKIIGDFRQIRAQREAHYQYLQTVIHHVGIGLIAFDDDGNVDLSNHATLLLFRLDSLSHLNQLEPFAPDFVPTLLKLKVSERKIIRIQGPEGQATLSVYATKFRRRGVPFTLISLQNISQELEEREMETWQSVLRAMTHEIRNSMTPIASLAATTLQMLEQPQTLCDSPGSADDARLAVRTIERRSNSLLHFVEAFRTLTHLPIPKIQTVRVADLLNQLRFFFLMQLQQKQIRCEFNVEQEDLTVQADPDLLEQVLINLVLNSMEALESRSNGLIELIARQDNFGRVHLEVSDNGPGISSEAKDRVFIPFFSTKPTGSGIGLSLSRLILRLHGATIQIHSRPDVRTTLEIIFPREVR